MKTATIRMLGTFWRELHEDVLSASPDERAAFFTAKHFETQNKIIFLADKLVPSGEADYLHKSALHLEVSPLYISRVLNTAEDSTNTSVVMSHSHPFEAGRPTYSASDDYGEALTSETISKNLHGHPPVGSILLGQTEASARVWVGSAGNKQTAAISVIDGNRFQFFDEESKPRPAEGQPRDRQVKAIGPQTQNVIEGLDVGIVGLGGTGSSVAEQLARMGVRKFKLVDHDVLETSNLSRLYGSFWKDNSRKGHKVDIVGAHISRIDPSIKSERIKQSVLSRQVLELLSECDVIFSCLDRHAPRAVLNELAYQCFIPVIDVGVGLRRSAQGLVGGSARASLIGPGLPCLFCNETVRPEVIAAEHLTPSEYESRRAEGYVPSGDGPAASVIAYTTLASALGATVFLDMITGSSSECVASTLLFDLMSKETIKIRATIKEDCVCLKRQGQGFDIPFSVAD